MAVTGKIKPIITDKETKKIKPIISDEEAKNTKVSLSGNDGKTFGEISTSAYNAIRGDYLDKYSPVDDDEKKVLDAFKNEPIVPFSIDADGETKEFGNISYNAYKAFESGNIGSYVPVNDIERVAIENYKTFTAPRMSPEQKAYTKYAVNKESNIDGLNNAPSDFSGQTIKAAPKKSAWNKFWENAVDFLTPAGSNAERIYDEATGFKENRGAWTDDQIAQMAVNALHNADSADNRDFAIVDEAYARLSRSTKYKDSDLVLALEEARKSWGASPLKAAGENVKAAVAGTVSDVASFANSLGADHVPVLKNVTNAAVEAGKDARQDAASYNKGEYGETLGAVTQGVVNLLPYYFLGTGKAAASAASKAPKALSFLKTAAKNPSFWYSLSTMWGGKYQEALDDGASRSSALANAVLYSVPAALVEVSGGVGAQGQQGKKLSSTIFEEIREELVQDLISGTADKVTTKPDLPIFSMTEDAVINPVNMAKTAVITAPIVAIGGGMSAGVSRMVNLTSQRIQLRKTTNDRKLINAITNFSDSVLKESLGISAEADAELTKSQLGEIGKMYSSKESIEALVEDGLQSPEGSASHTAAMEIEAKLKGNQKISNVEIGTLVEANIRQIATENAAVESAAAPVETVAESVESAPSEDSPASVSVGDTFKDAATGNTVTVVDRNDETTTVEIDTGAKTETREFTNSQADNLAANEQFEQIENAEQPEKVSPAEAQKYNIVVSNLKRKAEELGLLDNDFFTALQNVNMYNPSAKDKALISREFGRVFAGNTDPLVASWLNAIGTTAQPVTSINVENMHDSAEDAPADVSTADTGVELAEGEILSLKHTKSIYSLFKGAARVMVGKDIITDGFVVIPLTDEALADVKKVAGDVVQENPNLSLDKFYRKDNDVVIQGDPKVGEGKAGNKKVDAYVFKIGDTFYSCQQKYIDTFNNGKNSIKANKDVRIPWTVHDENGNFVALFLGLNAATTEENYGAMRSVSEIKATEKQKKAENASKPFNQNEVKQIIGSDRAISLTVNGSMYVGDGQIIVKCNDAELDFLNKEYRERYSNSNREIEHNGNIGARVEKMLSDATELAEANEHVPWTDVVTKNKGNAYVVGDYAIIFSKAYADIIKKRSRTMKIVSGGTFGSTLIVGYDADGSVTGIALPILAKGEITTKDGRTVPFVNDSNLKKLVTVDTESGIKSDKTVTENPESVTEPTGSVIKKADSVTETPENVANIEEKTTIGQLFEDYNGTVDDILSVSDETAKDFADKRVAVEVLKNTPTVILDNVEDARDLKVIISYNKLYLAVRKSGVFKGHYHNLGADIAKKLPEFLSAPDAIIRLANGRLNLFATVATERGDNGIISVELNSTKDINGKYDDYNVVVTMFSSNDNYAQNLISGDGVTEKYKREDLSQVNPQLYKWLAIINDKSSTDNIISQDNDIVNSSVRIGTEKDTTVLTDKCELVATKHTASGDDIWVVTLKDRLSSDEYKDLSGKVKAVGGYYSRFAKTPEGKAIPGFVFKSEPTAKELGVFNDFFGYSEAAPADTSNTVADEVLKNRPENAIIEENTDEEGTKNVESESEILAEESKPDGGGLRAGASEPVAETGVEEADRSHRDGSGKGLPESDGTDGSGSDVRNDSEGVYGTDDAADASGEADGASAEIDDGEPETIDTEVKTVEKKRPSNKGNFVITDDIAAEFDNTPPSAKDNIEAIELLLTLESEGRAATAEEKKILAKYKGWGGIDTRYMPYELSSRFGKLFDWEQRKSLQSSQNNAFFTPTRVIDAMYEGLKRMGFKGGNVLESSMGVGNFFGRMPAVMTAKSALTGVELESYTARIAQYLYPGATVINMPFQDVAIKNGSYDLVIGNVPFGQNKISYNKKKYSLHNYFIISSLDKVRDGGIVAVITSAGTLESHSIDARSAIMDRADVVACYKLPEKVFSRNASTDVQTDLLILRKRASGEKPKGDSILNTTTTADGLRVNEYFIKHPENILGTLAKGTNAWGEITTVLDDGNFYEKLNAAMKKLPKDLISGKVDLKPVDTIVSLSDKPRFFEKNGKIYADDGAGTATEVSKNQTNTVRDYMAVRDAYKAMLSAYDNDLSDDAIKPLRDALSKAYDKFYKNHGAITGDGKKKIGTQKSTNNTFLEADADYYLVSGLERYDTKNNAFVKSALFEKDTLRKKRVTSVDAASDALAISLNESGKIDFDLMQDLTGKTEKQLAEDLKGEIVLTPEGDYVLTDIYLSGNIYEKLEAVKGKPEFKEQQEMLEKVIPTPKGASDITVKLGANYIDSAYIEQFAREILNSHLTIKKDISGRWVIEGVKQARYGDIVNVKYGCDAFNAVQLLEKILNDGEITATKKVGTGRDVVTVLDSEMTEVARQKADDIRAAFESWIFADSDRRTKIVDNYNRTYNNYRPLDYERIAEKLSFDSMDETLKSKLYPHQKKGIARFLFGGNILFAHGVGTGKTFEMIASVMEAKRMGIINKAAMVVPNNKVVDFKNDIAQAYPNAKVLVIDTANKKRQTMLGLVNSNDWDIVLIARTTFTKIPVSRELQAHFISQQLEDLELQIAEASSDRNVTKRQLKGMITQRDNFEQKLKDLNSDTARDENSVDFEKLGIDCICVDEAHNYKSIMTPTKLDIKGLVNRNNAQMANDMLMKLDYLRSIDGKIIFGTGTPITNTVSEIYNMMRMVRPDILEEADIHSLDEWVNTFAKIETITEIGIDNQVKAKSTQIIRNFINVSEMIGMFRQFADIVFTTDVVKNLPKAVYRDVELEGTSEHKQIERQISDVIKNTPKSDLLKVYGQLMTMADAASVDLRMLSGAESDHNIFKDYSLEELDYADSKINVMCDKVYEEYTASNKIKGTQIIFCDKGSGSGMVYSFNLHKDIVRKLVERGIPEDQIVIIKNQSDALLEALYDKVNAGEVRVLIGTSQKMAEGLNVQKRVVAIHHPTVTYKPSDKEQGDARGVRAGNINDEVHIYRYLQKNTFDSHKWQAQDRKGEMINKALRGELVSEMEDIGADEDSGAGVDAATAMAITSGNPLVKEKIDIDKEVLRLKTLQRNYLSEVYRYQDAISKNPGLIRQLTAYAENLVTDIALKNKYAEKASIVIKGKTFDKQTEANKALAEAVKSAPKNGQFTKLGTYNGFDIMFRGDTGGMNYAITLNGANKYAVEYAGSGNNIARFAGALNRLDAELDRVNKTLTALKSDLEFAKQEVSKPFDKEKELTEALEKQKDITYRYEHYNDKTATNAEASDTDNSETVQSSRDLSSGDSAERWTTERLEGNKGKGVNLADIVRSISKKFDIPIATGKVTDSEASGIYKRKAETIRTRIANNLPTISHELGHHLDKEYGFSNMKSAELLKSSLPADFLEQYEEADRGREAVAEFVRVYLKNTNDANRLCPEFYADFISTLSKEDLKSLNEIAASVNEYLSYDISERYDAAIIPSKKQAKPTFKEKWKKLYTNWVDAFHPQKEAVDYVEKVTGQTLSGKDNAYVLATNSLNAHTIANYLICEGFRDLDGNIVDAKSFVDCIGMVDSKNVALLDKYLVLRHSLEWIEPTESDVAPKRVFADDTLENVEEIKKQIANIEAEHPEIKTASENLYEYQNNIIRHFVIPSGGMSEGTLNMLNRKYPSYVPFYRAVGNKKSGMAKGTFVNQRSPIMRAKGSGALILSPTESIIRNTEKMVKLALRNQTARVLSSYADTVDGFGQFMEAIPPDMIPHSVNIVKSKEAFTDALQQVVSSGEDFFAVSDLLEQIFGDEVTDFTPVANANKRIVTVLKDGRPTYYQIHDEALYNALAELAPQQANGYIKWATKIMQPMKLLITQNNPIFAGTNAIRDFGTAYKLSKVNNLAVFTAQYAKALGGIISNNADYKLYKAMGGGHSSELSANVDNIAQTLRKVAHKDMGKARRLAYSIFVHPVETVAMINDAIESVPRFAEFQRTLKKSGDLQEAIFNANDITTNFKRSGGGVGVKIANSTFMFNNAAIQGLDKTFRTLTDKDIKKRYSILLKWLLHALFMGMIGYLYNRMVDEEGYKNLSSYKKNNFYNFAIGDGMFISLPKPRENALLDTLTERVIEYAFGNENAFYDFSTYLGNQLIPPMIPDDFKSIEDVAHSWLSGTVLGGVVDIGFNQDFKDTPIEGTYDIYSPSHERYTESTSKPAYLLGQTRFARATDLSPKKIDHLISSYTGIIGQVNKALFPMNDERRDASIGLHNKFISDSNYSTDVLNRLYENEEKAEKAFNYSGSVDTAVEYEKNAIVTSYISGMNKAVKALPEEEQRKGRAYLLKNLNSWNYGYTASQTNMLNGLEGVTVNTDCIFTDLPTSTLEWTVDKQKYVYQMTPQEYHKYITDYLTVVENARKHYGNGTVESYEAAKAAAKEYMSKYKKTVLKEMYLTKAVPKAG